MSRGKRGAATVSRAAERQQVWGAALLLLAVLLLVLWRLWPLL